MKCVGIILISLMLVASYDAATVTCRSDPTTDEDQQAVDDGDTFTLTCDLTNTGNNNNDHVESCSWNHYEPLNEDRGNTYVPDIECAYALSGQSSNCPSDTRITGTVNTGSCSIQVSNSKPEDTGVWEAKISTRLSNTKQVSSIDISTYNQSLVEILDDSENERDATNSVRTKYNWNDKQEDWEDDESNWETVELICYAAGGRPLPKFTWQINGDDLSDDSNFDNEAARLDGAGTVYQSYGYKGAIQDMEAKLTFTVNTELLEILNSRHNIDTNPENGDFDFDIDCIVEQDGIETAKETVRIDVQKSHDDGHLKGSMIGVIVGVVIAVIILVAAIALLIFAKSSAIWCFAEDDRNYKDPKASRPRGPGPQQPQQQVYTREAALDKLQPAVIPATTKISEQPSSTKPPISSRRSSSSSSGNNNNTVNAGVNANFPRQQGEWIDQNGAQPGANPTIIKQQKQSSKRSTTSGHSTGSSTSNNMTNNIPPARPPKSAELKYASLDKKFMENPKNQVLPTVINVNSPAGTIATPSFPPSTSPYATIVSSSIRSTEHRVNDQVVSSSVHREEYRN